MDDVRPNPIAPSPRPHRNWLRLLATIIGILAVITGGFFGVRTAYQWMRRSAVPSVVSPPESREKQIVQIQPPQTDPFPSDKDRDGISDEEEAMAGTSDLEFDTDHDGLSDADEINVWQTDPTKRDTDGDGYSDGLEAIKGFNPKGAGKLK
ncbi:MAG: hypothetical protein AAB408_02040 [Patescibacteria group bacterium]